MQTVIFVLLIFFGLFLFSLMAKAIAIISFFAMIYFLSVGNIGAALLSIFLLCISLLLAPKERNITIQRW
jgi:hypothetical protein